MTVAFCRPASASEDFAGRLRRAWTILAHLLLTAPKGRLVSLTVPLALSDLPDIFTLDAETYWAADGEIACARSEAFAVEGASPQQLAQAFSDLHRRWDWHGDDLPPRAFFAFPFRKPGGRLWVPRLALFRRPDGAAAVLTAIAGGSVEAGLAETTKLLSGALRPDPSLPLTARRVGEDPPQPDWLDRVSAAAVAIAGGRLDKVVLSRSLDLALSRPLDPGRTAAALSERYPDCTVFVVPEAGGSVLAASPERLAVKHGDRVVSHCLAGTARRGACPDEDQALRAALLASAKERREHALVVGAVTEALAGLCSDISHPPRPAIMPLRLLQHLWTPVVGRVQLDHHLLDVVARLHPTPAVAGWPRTAALAWLEDIGERREGCYTGAAGWIDANGDGEAAVVLRSARVEGCSARLWAGAGILADSQPEAELAETELKLATLLEVLEQG